MIRLCRSLAFAALVTALAGTHLGPASSQQRTTLRQFEGIIHAHSTYSDNRDSNLDELQEMAHRDGYMFVMPTDHIDCFDEYRRGGVHWVEGEWWSSHTHWASKKPGSKMPDPNNPFFRYVERCWWLNLDPEHTNRPRMIAGEEFPVGAKDHLLILGLMEESGLPGRDKYWRLPYQPGLTTRQVIRAVSDRCEQLRREGKTPRHSVVIAHPHDWSDASFYATEILGCTAVEFVNNTGRFVDAAMREAAARGIRNLTVLQALPDAAPKAARGMVEVYKAASRAVAEADRQDLGCYLDLMRQDARRTNESRLFPGVTGGSDVHIGGYRDRSTFVLAEEYSIDGILDGVLCRRTYASYQHTRIRIDDHPLGLARPYAPDEALTGSWDSRTLLELIPAENRVSAVAFSAAVDVGEGRAGDYQVSVYRDGRECADGVTAAPRGRRISIDFRDTTARPDRIYAYTIVVRSARTGWIHLIASPILFYVQPAVEGRPERAVGGMPTTTVFVIDCSGSMSRDTPDGVVKLDAATRAVKRYLNVIDFDVGELHADHRVGIVSFSESASVVLAPTSEIDAARSALSSLAPQSTTNFGVALDQALGLLERRAERRSSARKIIIFLSDGMTNVGPVEHDQFLVDRPEDLSLYARARAAGIRIFTVGFGDPSKAVSGASGMPDDALDEAVLQKMALVPGTGGRYYDATDAFRLSHVYELGFHTATGNIVLDQTGTIAQGERKHIGPFNPARGSTVSPGRRRAVIPFAVPAAWAAGESGSQMLVTLSWSDGELGFELKDPAGTTVDESYPGASIRRDTQPVCLAIENPRVGDWTATVSGDNVPGGSVNYSVIVSARLPSQGAGGGGGASAGASGPVGVLATLSGLTLVAAGVLAVKTTRRRRIGPARRGRQSAAGPAVCLQEQSSGRAVRVTRVPYLIGRSPSCALVLDSPDVSREHAVITRERAAYILSDLGGAAGTFVNGARIARQQLADGDRIRVGSVELLFHVIRAASPKAYRGPDG